MQTPDPQAVLAILVEVAQSEILPRFRTLGQDAVRAKSHAHDLVTDADVEAERVLTGRLADLLPGSLVVGEEAVHARPEVLDRIGGAAPVWIVDPVDGTGNFVHGRPRFATAVALTIGARTVAGWIHDPLAGVTAVVEAGAGAWLYDSAGAAQRLAVSGQGQPLDALEASVTRKPRNLHGAFARVRRQGSAAHDYLALASGRLHVASFSRLMPWDHAAGVLLHAEAGGYGALVDGTPYRPTLREGTILLAPDAATWQAVAAIYHAGMADSP
jgi:fructose-1,6-bisphosphatase/inositol monophosphatase family enzyme